MTYQDLLDVLMAQPGQTPLARQAPGIQALAAGALGRRLEPETRGVANELTRPNDERAMSGEIHGGLVADGGGAEFHAFDPIVPPGIVHIFGIPAPHAAAQGNAGPRRAQPRAAENPFGTGRAAVHIAVEPLPKSDLGRV